MTSEKAVKPLSEMRCDRCGELMDAQPGQSFFGSTDGRLWHSGCAPSQNTHPAPASDEAVERLARAMFDLYCPGIRYTESDKAYYGGFAALALAAMPAIRAIEPSEAQGEVNNAWLQWKAGELTAEEALNAIFDAVVCPPLTAMPEPRQMSTCEICDTPDLCGLGQCPCTLSGEFVAPVPADVANRLLNQLREAEIEAIIGGLTDLECELLLGESSGWGSWMFSVGSDLCTKGLGTKRDGSITFDTPLAKRVIAALRSTTAASEPDPLGDGEDFGVTGEWWGTAPMPTEAMALKLLAERERMLGFTGYADWLDAGCPAQADGFEYPQEKLDDIRFYLLRAMQSAAQGPEQ